jgi:hypothetical protein
MPLVSKLLKKVGAISPVLQARSDRVCHDGCQITYGKLAAPPRRIDIELCVGVILFGCGRSGQPLNSLI